MACSVSAHMPTHAAFPTLLLSPCPHFTSEVVALFNTIAKFSSAIHYVKELTALQYTKYNQACS